MDSSLVTATAAALGSLAGAAATILTTWMMQRTQLARAQMEEKLRERETLYGEFITEATRLTVDALGHSLEQAEPLERLYGILGRIRLVAAEPVLAAADACCRQIVNLYSRPNLKVAEIPDAFERDRVDPIKEFSAACRTELLEIASSH
jgi:hypothetical protein